MTILDVNMSHQHYMYPLTQTIIQAIIKKMHLQHPIHTQRKWIGKAHEFLLEYPIDTLTVQETK